MAGILPQGTSTPGDSEGALFLEDESEFVLTTSAPVTPQPSVSVVLVVFARTQECSGNHPTGRQKSVLLT